MSRVLFQVVSCDKMDYSPAVYGHDFGDHIDEIITRLRRRMLGREFEVDEVAARLVQEMLVNDHPYFAGQRGLALQCTYGILQPEDSPGDAGIVLITALPGLPITRIP